MFLQGYGRLMSSPNAPCRRNKNFFVLCNQIARDRWVWSSRWRGNFLLGPFPFHYPLILVPYDECITYSVRPLTATVTNSTLIMCSHDQFIWKGRQSAVPLGYSRYVCEWRRRVWNGWRTSSGRRQLDPWSLRWYLLKRKIITIIILSILLVWILIDTHKNRHFLR